MIKKVKLQVTDLKKDFVLFSTIVLGYQVKPFHKRWVDFQINNKQTLVLAPRDHGKSIVLNISYLLWKIVNNPNYRILIASNSSSMAEQFLSLIKQHFEKNTVLRQLFGEYVNPNRWNSNSIVVKKRTLYSLKEPTVSTTGLYGSLVSGHYDLILADDLVDFENSRTQGQRDKAWDWLWTVLYPTLETYESNPKRNGELHFIGTRYHYDDLYGRLMGDVDKYKPGALENLYIRDQAITTQPDGTQVALWEEKKSLSTLQDVKRKAGSIIFSLQYQNDASLTKGRIFNYDILYNTYDNLPADLSIFAGYDLAVGQKTENDYFTEAVIGVDKQENIYILSLYRNRLTAPQQFDRIKQTYTRMKFLRCGVESVAYQEALPQWLRANTAIPVLSIKRRNDKVMRAMKLLPLFENGKILFPHVEDDYLRALRNELILFPDGAHDDLFDALDTAIETATNGKSNFQFQFV